MNHRAEAGGKELLLSWNRCHGAFYRVSESDFLWNCREQNLLRYWTGELEGVPVLWAEAAPEGERLGIPREGIWLSLHGEIPPGREGGFAAAAESFARAKEKARLAIGGDEFHFLPGIPVDEPAGSRLAEAFRQQGFSSAGCADFLGRPLNPQSAECVRRAREDAAAKGWACVPVGGGSEREGLTAFLTKEFPGRWLREWQVWSARNDTGRAFWSLLRDEKGRALGFSRLALRGRLRPESTGWTPGAMRLPLEPGIERADTDSCLGPIGISASERGRGAGRILLGLSLHELSLQGAERTCIDWTNAYNYYTPLGFAVGRRYQTVWRILKGA
jgi:hypothetical protein